jgi:hypothetical protein
MCCGCLMSSYTIANAFSILRSLHGKRAKVCGCCAVVRGTTNLSGCVLPRVTGTTPTTETTMWDFECCVQPVRPCCQSPAAYGQAECALGCP